jgi:LytS/YehU family sensor histidine kinase
VDIMSLRFGDRLKVTIDVAEETRDARVPTLFLQPLVENAFRHWLRRIAGRRYGVGTRSSCRRHAVVRDHG